MSTSQPTSSQATACTHCREKKLRCDRERPRCSYCRQDGAECEYSMPGKRVNHIKLLCDSVGGVIDRLSSVESELSRLNLMLKSTPSQLEPSDGGPPQRSGSEPPPEGDEPTRNAVDRHTIRNHSDMGDQYHGPNSTLTLCMKFRRELLDQNTQRLADGNDDTNDESVAPYMSDHLRNRLDRLCLEASREESPGSWQPLPCSAIRFPPKQFLSMVQSQFFQRLTYATDVFVQSSFWSNVQQLYSRPFRPSDEPWAICCNTIILLVLGSESANQRNDDPIVNSQFALPFFTAVRSALASSPSLTAPRLINVQALTLLAIVSHQYFPTDLSDSIFAQACMVARRMGLHQMHVVPEGISSEEIEERRKVFLSLYLQDKVFSMAKGSLCWLPSFDCSILSEMHPSDSTYVGRVELARLQEDIYQYFYSSESQSQPNSKMKSKLLQMEQGLYSWAADNDITTLSPRIPRNASLQLDYLATVITVLRRSTETRHIQEVLQIARASCLILLSAYDKHDKLSSARLKQLLSTNSKSDSDVGHKGESESEDVMQSASADVDTTSLNPYSMMHAISVPGIFLLVENIIKSKEGEIDEDLDLLKELYSCFSEHDNRSHVKISRILHQLLEITTLIKKPNDPWPLQPPTESSGSNTRLASTPEYPLVKTPPTFDFSSMPSFSPSNAGQAQSACSWNIAAPINTGTFRPRTSPTQNPTADSSIYDSAFMVHGSTEQAHFPDIAYQDPSQPRKKRQYSPDQDFRLDTDPDLTSMGDFVFTMPTMTPFSTLG